jgi:hypothetical protein
VCDRININKCVLLHEYINGSRKLGMVVQACNASTWEGEAVRSQVPGQPELHSETLSQTVQHNTKQNKWE